MPELEESLVEQKQDSIVGKLFAGRYQILSLLGEGGMGAVYKAEHVHMKRIVALKILLPGTFLTETTLKRFQKEAQASSSLQHPNVVTIHEFDIDKETNQTFLVMDLIQGRNLQDELEAGGPLTLERFIHIFSQACDAFSHAHAKGVIHRDIKDTNIMLVENDGDRDFVKVVDFGLAKISSDEGDPTKRLTESGAFVGTPLFMSPEQCRGHKCDARSDIYSLGCVMYEALCGQLPFRADTMLDIMHKHIREFAPPMGVVSPSLRITRSQEVLISKCLAKEPQSRFQTMAELKAELLKLTASPSAATPVGTPTAAAAPLVEQAPSVVSAPAGLNSTNASTVKRKSSQSAVNQMRAKRMETVYWVAAILIISSLVGAGVVFINNNGGSIKARDKQEEVTSTGSEVSEMTLQSQTPAAPQRTNQPTASVTTMTGKRTVGRIESATNKRTAAETAEQSTVKTRPLKTEPVVSESGQPAESGTNTSINKTEPSKQFEGEFFSSQKSLDDLFKKPQTTSAPQSYIQQPQPATTQPTAVAPPQQPPMQAPPLPPDLGNPPPGGAYPPGTQFTPEGIPYPAGFPPPPPGSRRGPRPPGM